MAPNPTHQATSKLLTVKQTCELLAVSPTTLWRITRDGDIRAVRIRTNTRYDMVDLERYIESAKTKTPIG